MRPRTTLAVALLATLVTFALALARSQLGTPALGAEILGGPFQGLRTVSVRVATIERRDGVDRPRSAGEVSVRIGSGIARAHTGADGIADVRVDLERPLESEPRASVRALSGHMLAEGTLRPVHAGWGPARRGGPIPGQGKGELRIVAIAGRGVVAPPFPEFLVVRVMRGNEPASGGIVTIETDGAEARMAEGGLVNSLGNASGTVTATSREAAIRLQAWSSQGSGALIAPLPTLTGAMWLDPEGLSAKPPRLRILSPVPSAIAYLTIADDSARLWGGSVPLAPGDKTAAEGAIDWPLVPGTDTPPGTARLAWVTVSPDPRAESGMSVGWPILIDNKMRPLRPSDALDERRFADMVLLDGMPGAEAHEAAMRWGARLLGVIGVVAGLALAALIVLESTLLAWRGRPRGWARLTALYAAAVVLAVSALSVVALWMVG